MSPLHLDSFSKSDTKIVASISRTGLGFNVISTPLLSLSCNGNSDYLIINGGEGRKSDDEQYWHFPFAGLEIDELPLECAKRALQDQIDLRVTGSENPFSNITARLGGYEVSWLTDNLVETFRARAVLQGGSLHFYYPMRCRGLIPPGSCVSLQSICAADLSVPLSSARWPQ